MNSGNRRWTSQAVDMRDNTRRSLGGFFDPGPYTDRELIERAGKRGTEAAKRPKTDKESKRPKKTDQNA